VLEQPTSRDASNAPNAEALSLNSRLESVPLAPSNELTLKTSKLCSALHISDVRYSLSVYGIFLKDLPKRLGTDDALDACVSLFTRGMPLVHCRELSQDQLEDYGHALGAVRLRLNDPSRVGSVNSLCAVYLMMISLVSVHLYTSVLAEY
jgi:hypothetical protein